MHKYNGIIRTFMIINNNNLHTVIVHPCVPKILGKYVFAARLLLMYYSIKHLDIHNTNI